MPTQAVIERAKAHVLSAATYGVIVGCVGAQGPRAHSVTLRRLAGLGVPENLTLAFETDELRSLVKELAEIFVDCGRSAFDLFGTIPIVAGEDREPTADGWF